MTTEQQTNKPIIWTISGSDCSGGAGIAADIKTGHALGVEVCHLITANTVQNSQKLVAVNPIDVDILALQANTLLQDKKPSVIKIGLIANVAQVNWLVDFLSTLKFQSKVQVDNQKDATYYQKPLTVIYDPVGQASVGGENGGKFSALTLAQLHNLLPLIDIITPNSSEAQFLANSTSISSKTLAQKILARDVNSVIVKGGHPLDDSTSLKQGMNKNQAQKSCFDYYLHKLTDADSSKMSKDEIIEYGLVSEKINTDYNHGGGCSFATALASFAAHGYLLRDAFTLTKAFINQGLKANNGKHDHYGAFEQTSKPQLAQAFPKINVPLVEKYQKLPPFASLNVNRGGIDKLGLYPVIDSLYWLEQLLPLKLNIIQLRIKNKPQAELENIIKQAVELNKQYPNTRLFINDYWQLAIKYGAYGVHIGQEDLINADLTKIQQAGLRLGISTHGCYEFLLAQQLQPSYLAIGAIFPTKTKDMTGQIQGIENLTETLKLATHIPVVAIGGINHQRAIDVLATGVDSIAVVTAITEADNPEFAVAKFKTLVEKSLCALK